MGALGGDVVAAVCIMGGAAVSWGATLAVLERDGERVDVACAIETTSHGSHAWVDVRGEGAVVVVRPHVAIGMGRECVSVRAAWKVERAARELEGLDEAIEAQIEGLDMTIKAEIEKAVRAGLAGEAVREGGWSGGGE